MCFRIESPEKIAKKDIHCYKILNKDMSNYFSNAIDVLLVYPLNKSMPNVSLEPFFGLYIFKGYHSYSTKKEAQSTINFVERKTLEDKREGTILNAIIPKGTKYYKNTEFNEFVSETIMIIG